MNTPRAHVIALACTLVACGVASSTQSPDLAAPDLASITAASYCEATVDSFCAFYLRCGRMAVSTVEQCRAVFLETCNARFEPRYVDLEAAGLITLSTSGVAACASHLGSVACQDQLLDLDGPCGAMWTGTQTAGAPCGLDVESFVCAPGTYCRLDLTLCGVCTAGSATPTSRNFTYVAEGAACDADHRCPYLTTCISGVCQGSARLSEACGATAACTSGQCLNATCQPFSADGTSCAHGAECSSGYCEGGSCHPLPDVCLR
jgi:hypothetical protein